MDDAKYSVEDIASQAGIPMCLVNYYIHIGLIGDRESSSDDALPEGLELVNFEDFIQCAAGAGLTHEEKHCLLDLNERADARALRLASTKLTELIQQQRCIVKLQAHLEVWLFKYYLQTENTEASKFIK